jgi:hypothetical protein
MFYFAQAYGQGNYGEGTYSCPASLSNDGTCVASTGGPTATTPGAGGGTSGQGGLADTGVAVLLIVTVACLLIFAGLVVRIWRRPKPALQEAAVVTPADQPDDANPRKD